MARAAWAEHVNSHVAGRAPPTGRVSGIPWGAGGPTCLLANRAKKKQALTFYVDDKPHHIVGNSCALPFNWNQFIILNVAMGGNMGGEIASDFVSDTMEIEYVRIYQ